MALFALVAYLVFLLVAFGWRTWVHYRRTGDTGFRGFSRAPGERLGGVLVVAGALLALLAPLAELAGWLAPAAFAAQPGVRAAGLLALVAGAGLTVLAQVQMGVSWRIGVDPGERTALVSHGVFRSIRNPIFTGMLLALAGLALVVPNALSWLGAILVGVGLELQVRRVEEPHLLRVHGERYREYARTAGRFLPGIGRLPPVPRSRGDT